MHYHARLSIRIQNPSPHIQIEVSHRYEIDLDLSLMNAVEIVLYHSLYLLPLHAGY